MRQQNVKYSSKYESVSEQNNKNQKREENQ